LLDVGVGPVAIDPQIDVSDLTPSHNIVGDDEEDTVLLREMSIEAEKFLRSHKWCKDIKSLYFGGGVGGIIAVFLAEIDPPPDAADKFLWVIVGDIPPAYLVTDRAKDCVSAARVYVEEMRRWVECAQNGEALDKCIPVNIAPKPENIRNLYTRLDFIDGTIIPELIMKTGEKRGQE
jgi:hypothetical protein